MIKEVFIAWIKAARPQFLITTIIPLILGGLLAYQDGYWNLTHWLIVVAASSLVFINVNLANDYFEYETDSLVGSIGGSRGLQKGLITLRQMRWVMISLYLFALILGLYLILATQVYTLLILVLFAALSSLFYTAPPIKYAYRGLGEIMVGINMGPVMVLGTYMVLSGTGSLIVVMISFAIAELVALILFYQSLSDIEDDRKINKNTLAVRIGSKSIPAAFLIFNLIYFLTVFLLIYFSYLSSMAWLTSFTSFITIFIYKMIKNESDWSRLHDKGKWIRLFYIVNSLIIIYSV